MACTISRLLQEARMPVDLLFRRQRRLELERAALAKPEARSICSHVNGQNGQGSRPKIFRPQQLGVITQKIY